MAKVSKEAIEALAANPLFAGCSQQELRTIVGLGTTIQVPEGRVLTEEGGVAREMFIVRSGQATVRIGRRKVGAVGPGDTFGELSLLDGGARTATVTADTAMELVVLDWPEFRRLLETSPKVSMKILAATAARLRAADATSYV